MNSSRVKPPLVLYEDDHLLAIHKPSGINTHKPDPYAQDGIHEWLKKQRPEWRNLSVLHRLDKETSGVMVFGKSPLANQSLTRQFERGTVKKSYFFPSRTGVLPDPSWKQDRQDACPVKTVATPIDGKPAQTTFRLRQRMGDLVLMEAQPATGRTHQVRVHAAEAGCPVLGDKLHGRGETDVPRLMLYASRLELQHPETGRLLCFEVPPPNYPIRCNDRYIEWDNSVVGESRSRGASVTACARQFRELLFDASSTNSYRLISSAADGFPDWMIDRFGEVLLVQRLAGRAPLPEVFRTLSEVFKVFVQDLTPGGKTKPQPLAQSGQPSATGDPHPLARENGLQFVIRMDQGFSPGLFLDQRENRRRLQTISNGKEVLNCFAYTCAFSVAAAVGGAKTTSVDLSKSYLDWGRDNFRVNKLDPGSHDFIFGDVFDWLKRFVNRGRTWDIVLLDPPTFGTTKKGRVFRAAKDYGELVRLAAKLVRKEGALFCSTNQRSVAADEFVATIRGALQKEKRDLRAGNFETQPFDFRIADGEKPYLKTFWATLA